MKKTRTQQLSQKLLNAHSLDKICRVLGVPDTWDCLIVCDGSGTTWKTPAGYGWTLIQRKPTFRRILGSGSMSHGSNIAAELFAFLHPLSLLAQEKIRGTLRVHVITDCQIMSTWGNGNKGDHSAYEEMWFLIGSYERRGMKVAYHWLPRDTIDLNKLAHDMANVARKMQELVLPRAEKKILKKLGKPDIYHLNPLD